VMCSLQCHVTVPHGRPILIGAGQQFRARVHQRRPRRSHDVAERLAVCPCDKLAGLTMCLTIRLTICLSGHAHNYARVMANELTRSHR
jgi:hypothetical protein